MISDTSLWTPDDYEAFLLKHVDRLHPHNGLLISIKSRCDHGAHFPYFTVSSAPAKVYFFFRKGCVGCTDGAVVTRYRS